MAAPYVSANMTNEITVIASISTHFNYFFLILRFLENCNTFYSKIDIGRHITFSFLSHGVTLVL